MKRINTVLSVIILFAMLMFPQNVSATHTDSLMQDLSILTVTAENQTITYGDPDPVFIFTYSGFVGGDTSAVIDTSPTCTVSVPHTDIGTYPIICSGGEDNAYDFTYVDGSLTVAPKPLTITAGNQGKTYGFTITFNGTEFTTTGLIFADTVTSVTLISTGAPATAVTDTYPIVPTNAVGTGLSNYAITYVNGTLTVGGNLLIITANDFVGANAKTYGNTFTLTGTEFTVTGLQPGDAVTSVTLTSVGAPYAADVGTYPIIPSNAVGTGLNNYVIVYLAGQLDVNQAFLTFNPDSHTKVYGDTFTGYTGTFTGLFAFDNTVTPVYDSPGEPATATATAPGPTYPINVSFNDPNDRLRNYIFTVDPNPAATLTVLPRTLTVTPTNWSKIYGDALTSADFTSTITGIQNGDNITAAYDSSLGDSATAAVGPYDIVTTLSDPDGMLGNYTLVNNIGTLTVNQRDLVVTSDNQSKIYGDVFSAFTGSVVGLQNGDVITPTYASTGAPAAATAGNYPITVTLNDPGNKLPNYNVILNTGTLTVGQYTLIVTPADKIKIYGDLFTAFTGTLVGVRPGDNITVTYSSTGAPANAAVGTYPITATLNDPGNKLPNYAVILNIGTLTVTPRVLVVTPDDKAKVFGTFFHAFTGTITGVQAGDTITATYASVGAPAAAVAGNYPITVTLNAPPAVLSNYTVTLNTGILTVGTNVLTVTANNQTMVYGNSDPVFTFTYAGFQGGDTPVVIDTPPTCTVSNPHLDVGAYPIICSGGIDNNYTFSYVAGTLTINSRALVVTPDDKTKVYGDIFTAFTGTITGIQPGDNITVTYSSAGAPALATIGVYPIIATLNDPGARLANYNVILNTSTLIVTQPTLVVTSDDKAKVYGDVTALTGSIIGLQNGDNITVTYSSLGAPGVAAVGTYPINVTLNDPGNELLNYNVTINTGTLTVNSRALAVTPDNKAKTFGNVFTAFTGTVVGLQNGDLITATYYSVGAPTAAPVGTYPITATLNDPSNRSPNYSVTFNTGELTVGTKVLTVMADNQTITYGDPDPVFTFIYTGFAGGDTSIVIDTSPTCTVSIPYHNTNIGSYPIVCSGGVDNNYIFSYTPGTLTINSRALVMTPDDKTKVYGDVFTAFTGTITGIQNGDLITATYASTGAPATAPSGTYPIIATLTDPFNRLSNYLVTFNTGTLMVTLPPVPTPTGTDVTVSIGSDLNLHFGTVTQEGLTTMVPTSVDSGDLPPNFQLLGQVYDISTSAIFTSAQTCFTYDDAGLTPSQESAIRLFHLENNTWTDVTDAGYPNTTNNMVCGTVTSFSPFAIMHRLDTTPPTITWVGNISNGHNYYFGFVPSEPTCTASDLSGLDGPCTVTGYATTIGAHTLTATARDMAGNVATETKSYTVMAWTLTGFYQPVDVNGIYNTVKGGSTVPFKFEVFAGSTELTDVADIKSFTYAQTACNANALTDEIETLATGGTGLRYVDGQFIYNWKTPKTAGTCYRVTMTTIDGSSLVAYFKLK